MCDSIASANGQISKVIATLKQQGAAEINARYEWGGACADTVVMYGPPEVFVREIVSAIELNKKRLMSQQ